MATLAYDAVPPGHPIQPLLARMAVLEPERTSARELGWRKGQEMVVRCQQLAASPPGWPPRKEGALRNDVAPCNGESC